MKHHLPETHEHNFEIHNIVLYSQSISLKFNSIYNFFFQLQQEPLSIRCDALSAG